MKSLPTPQRLRILGACSFVTLGLAIATAHAPVVHGQAQAAQAAAPTPTTLTDDQFFSQKVRPVLTQRCYQCHTSEQSGGLRLDSLSAVLKGGDTGPAMVPGDPDKSLMIQAVEHKGDLSMPPTGPKLPDGDIASLVEWVKRGGNWDSEASEAPVTALLTPAAAKASPGEEYFENNVRPLLVNNCGDCHMNGTTKGGLSLDSRASILKGGDTGPAIVLNDPEKSLLIQAVHQTGDLKMPPRGGKLTDAQVQTLSDWIRMGAPWPVSSVPVRAEGKQITPEMRKWWSFVPLKESPVPVIKDPALNAWAKTDIDKYVLAKLEEKGLTPAPMADKRTLIRRATLDLTGLPPTEEEITAFENDKSPEAFAKVVDRLLASPRYGERWGRHWLDVARYGDDDIRGLDPRGRGYMPFDGAWVYRDWVIKAFNDDMPYSQFVKLQLAGDLVSPHPTPEDLKGTGFLGGAPWIWDQAEPVSGRATERNERIDAVTRGFLGLTVACSRCHDHKYDPILSKDYYALGGIFANSTYKEYAFVPAAEVEYQKERLKDADDHSDQVRNYLKASSEQLALAYASQTASYMVASWHVLGDPKQTVEVAADAAKLDPEMLDRWVKFLAKKPVYYPYLQDWQRMIAQGGSEDQAKFLATSFQNRIIALEIARKEIDDENEKIEAKAGVPVVRVKDAKPNDFDTYNEFCPGCTLELKVLPPEQANLYTDLFVRGLGGGDEMQARGEPGLFVFSGWDLQRRLGSVEQAYLASLSGGGGEGGGRRGGGGVPQDYPFVHGVADKAKIVDIALDLRGNPNQHGDIVPRGFITVLQTPGEKPYTHGSGRLQLADDIIATPIATRVIVNRIWKWHFGTGIVDTPDNFGKVGDPPSDPELLEYLAVQFQKNGMSIKKLQRMIMLSAVYQQSSVETPDEHVKDRLNRYYSHFSVQRLDAEQLRDSILFVAGDLDLKHTGGPAVPFGVDNIDRTVFAKVSRFRIDPFLQAFDFPNATFTAAQRFSTNVPVQRLYFMNDPFVYKQAEVLSDRVYPAGDNAARITETYRLVFGRKPTPDELQAGIEFLKTTPDKPGYMVDQEPINAWKEYCRVLFSSNEFEFLN